MDHNWVYIVQKPPPPKPPKLSRHEQTYHGVSDLLAITQEQKADLIEAGELASVSVHAAIQ